LWSTLNLPRQQDNKVTILNILPLLYELEITLLLTETNADTVLQWTVNLAAQPSKAPVGSVPTTALNLEPKKPQLAAGYSFCSLALSGKCRSLTLNVLLNTWFVSKHVAVLCANLECFLLRSIL